MAVYTVDPLRDPRWHDFVESHRHGSAFHSVGWLKALRWTYGFEPVVYTTSPPAAELLNGIVFCRIKSWLTGRRMVSLPFADHCEPLLDTRQDSEELFQALEQAIKEEHWRYVEVRSFSDLLSNARMSKSNSFCWHMLDLRPTLQSLYLNLHKDSIQRKIKRASRESLRYEEGTSELLLNQFCNLLLLTRRRHKLPPQPVSWFRNLIAFMGDALKIRIALKDGRPVAGMLTLCHGDTMIYKYGCSDASYHSLGAMPFLFWRAIEEGKRRGLRCLDLGRSDTNNTGLVVFKDRLGAKRSTLTYLLLSGQVRQDQSETFKGKIFREILTRMPDAMLTKAGTLLYRHVG